MPTHPSGALLFLLGFWLALTLFAPIASPTEESRAANPTLARLEDELYRSVNAVRARHHKIALRRDSRLDAVARAHSEDMARRGYLAHESPEGTNPVDRLMRGGVEGFTLAGENVGLTTRPNPTDEILSGWLTSPEHRENLLAPVFNTAGLGIARSSTGALVYTQLYATFPRE